METLRGNARLLRKNWDRSQDVMRNPKMVWTPHLSVILAGVDDDSSVLSLLRGHESSLLQHIYSFSIKFVFDNWRNIVSPDYKQYVHNTIPACLLGDAKIIDISMAHHLEASCDDVLDRSQYIQNSPVHRDPLVVSHYQDPSNFRFGGRFRSYLEHKVDALDVHKVKAVAVQGSKCAFTRCGTVSFPPPSGIDINMMPFIMGDETSLPENLQEYYDPLVGMCPVSRTELGKVCYLSITERYIEKGNTQRRGGLHIEAPVHHFSFSPGGYKRARWGMGQMTLEEFKGGIYTASNVSNSCAIWDALVDKSTTDSHGGMEHLRPLLNAPYLIQANELIWMTDRTPHQAIPQYESGYRQFFRLVTSDFNVWHAQHCNANPKVPLPPHVRVINESRFQSNNTEYDEQNSAAHKRQEALI